MPRLMVVLDPREEVHSGLERIKELPPHTDLDIHVCAYVEADVARDLAATLQSRKTWLEEIVAPFREIGYRVTQEVVTFSRLHEAIIQSAVNCEADFLFKPMRQHSVARRMLVTSTDWNLIRHCPVPLYLVNASVEIHHKPILAALDVSGRDARHDQLNDVIMAQAQRVAQVVAAEVSCVNSWQVSGVAMAAGASDPAQVGIARDMQADHLLRARTVGEVYGIPAERVHVSEGPAELVITETARDISAGCVVIGTVARTGVSGLLLGNTAEAIVEHATTDVLVVKAADFKA